VKNDKPYTLGQADVLVQDLLRINRQYLKVFQPNHPYGDDHNTDYVQLFLVLKVLALRVPEVSEYIQKQIGWKHQQLTKQTVKHKKQTNLNTVRQS
tara:strand:- start:2418 stop:2705 length:288 start_codon:yes stop_codon:yes gene_type:complete